MYLTTKQTVFLFSALTMAFFVGKMTGFLAVSWWVVTSPLWFPLLVIFCVLFIAFMRGDFERH